METVSVRCCNAKLCAKLAAGWVGRDEHNLERTNCNTERTIFDDATTKNPCVREAGAWNASAAVVATLAVCERQRLGEGLVDSLATSFHAHRATVVREAVGAGDTTEQMGSNCGEMWTSILCWR